MLFGRKDFHGGRAYASDPCDENEPHSGSLATHVVRWIKVRLTRRLPVASPSISQGFSHGKSEGFSLLGCDDGHRLVRRLETNVFPMADRAGNTVGSGEAA